MKTLLIAILVCWSGAPQAQESEDIEDLLVLCEKVECYPPSTLTLTMESGETKEFELEYPIPVVQPLWIVVFPGANIFLTGDVEDEKLINMKVIADPGDGKNYLHLQMYQQEGKPDTYLRIENFYSDTIKYRAGIMKPDEEKLYATSSCALMPGGLVAFEHWPYPIFQIVMTDFHTLSVEGDGVFCE